MPRTVPRSMRRKPSVNLPGAVVPSSRVMPGVMLAVDQDEFGAGSTIAGRFPDYDTIAASYEADGATA